MKISRITKLTAIFLSVFMVLSAAAFLAGRPDLRYRISEILRRPDNTVLPKEFTIEEENLKQYSFSALKNDLRVVFGDSLMLINEKYTLSDEYTPELILFEESEHKINAEIAESFDRLITAVKDNCNEDLQIVSAYRNATEQEQTIKEEGENAAEVNASEHLTGLAIDVCVRYYGGNAFLKSEAGRFVNKYCCDYGFIVRYPMFAEKITGIGYEPWHLRYVGLPHSKIIQGAKLTFEEYIDYFEKGKFYQFEDYIITRQPKEDVRLPESFEKAVISEDNTGFYIITVL